MEGAIVVICIFIACAQPCSVDFMIKVPHLAVKKLNQSLVFLLLTLFLHAS